MNTILFPTDWSEDSLIAFEYASNYAMIKGCKMIVLNVFQISDPKIINDNALFDEAKENAYYAQREQSDAFFKLYKSKNGNVELDSMLLETRIIEGNPVDEIIDATKPMDIELVIMGTDGRKPNKNGILGTVTSGVIKKAFCPVIAVPPLKLDFPPDKILCALDFKNDERLAVSSIMNFASLFTADVTFVYVSKSQKTEAEQVTFREHLKTTQYYLSNLEHWKIEIIEGEDVVPRLVEYLENNKFDILALETTAHKGNEEVDYKSITHELSLQTKIPLFILHSNG